ncbi:endolytic transglycosylase MltG [Kitasatospora sp. NPDC101801]|uniref:endolytic transglycosylase MltG n=1 Tax=Kitasatospora sp. NPDC101801 TaxID=3364103 RepID=UPI00381C742E
MTDLGGGYQPQGTRPWQPGDPGPGDQWQQPQYAQDQYGGGQQGFPQQQPQQPQYGQPQQPQYVQPQQPGYPQQGQYGGYGQPQQPGYPQQPQYGQPQQQQPPQYVQQPQQPRRPMPQQGYNQPPQPAAPQPTGPGPDGIDWEAEAAALDAPQARPVVVEPEPEPWVDDEPEANQEPEQESFFGGQDDSRSAERNRKEKGKKSGRRNRGACLVVALVLLGGVGGAGWWGYGFYQDHFGPPPDFSGAGAGTVQVEIKPGPGEQMGRTLLAAGVVKSVEAFTSAFTRNSKANTIQPGFFTMHHQMSGDEAVKLLVDSAGGDALIVPEGKTAAVTYGLIDDKLKLAKGTTANVAKAQVATLGLPPYSGGNIEGFLYPTKYSISQGMKPEDLLKQMVANAIQHYQALNLDAGAQKAGLKSGYDVLIAASILQAEGNNSADFGKMARVISNRLNTDITQHKLGMDTTLQYFLGRTKLTSKEIDDGSTKFNTYVNTGLPPTPISNPGEDALKAVLNPTPGNVAFFIAMSATETRFTDSYAEHLKNVEEYCTAHNQGFDKGRGHCK